jgi:GAF domain-containing protein
MHEGPCYQAATESGHVVSADLATDERFPRYGRVAVEAGIRSQAGIRLFDSERARGALNLYASEPGVFEDLTVLGALFAHQAAVAIAYAGEVSNLRKALETRTTIGKAVGIVMERYDLPDDRAFAFLTRVSQHRNVKLNQVAEEVLTASRAGVGL